MSSFKDHFSAHASEYAAHRPVYPQALFDWIRSVAPADASVVWDCACGNGQASVDLAARFDRVIATDASERQIESAQAQSNVEYRVASATNSGLAEASVDVVTVAQALHWFAGDDFYNEVRRVLKPGGLLCAFGYGLQRIEPAIDERIDDFYWKSLDGYWPPERAHCDDLYASLPFPAPELESPQIPMTADWSLDQFLAYVDTWSGVRRNAEQTGSEPVEELAAAIAPLWGEHAAKRTVTWPLILRAAAPSP